MLLAESLLLKYKQCLTNLEYPFIKQKSDIEIRQLFDQEHRAYLLSWILTKLIPSYNLKLDDAKKNNKFDSVLANILYENGFCRAAEKETFVKDTLDNESQVLIFNRMFNLLSLIYENNESKENMSEMGLTWKQMFMNIQRDDFKSKIMYDINLTPALGNYKPLSENERNEKLLHFKTEIAKYKTHLEMESSENSVIDRIAEVPSISHEQIENLAAQFVNLSTNFAADNFVSAPGDNTVTTKVELEKFIGTSSEDITKLLEQLEKKQELNRAMNSEEILEENDYTSFEESDNNFGCVLQNFAIAENILQEYKRISED